MRSPHDAAYAGTPAGGARAILCLRFGANLDERLD
jgi:hypothetical protein